jgi:hypothetical protein
MSFNTGVKLGHIINRLTVSDNKVLRIFGMKRGKVLKIAA